MIRKQANRVYIIRGTLVFIALLYLCLFSTTGWAHRVNVFAWVEGGKIHTQSKFSGGKLVKNGKIQVYDSQKNNLLSGKVDNNGEFSFPIPQQTDLLVIIEAGGHKGDRIIKASELKETNISDQNTTQGSHKTIHLVEDSATKNQVGLEPKFEALLDRKLKPIHAKLAALRHRGTTITDILGGIGYIIGLVGLLTFLKYRKEQ